MELFTILITSPPDREKVVAEIWYQNNLTAEINQENGIFEIEIYAADNLILPVKDFLVSLESAVNKLNKYKDI